MLKSLLLIVVFAALCNSLLGAAAYTWPNTQTDHLEGLLYEQVPKINGVDQPAMAFGIIGCSRGASDSGVPLEGRTNSAEWLRTAYHDMATADVAAGTGGIDASIGFEFADRAENRGRAFFASLAFFNNHVSIRSSMADLIALGTTMAVGSCSNGTVLLPYRAGRIDALAPGPSGVPQPHEDLASHTASFARQGFNASEMAALVACGHTLGGVHGSDFPEIVPVVKDPTSSTNRQDFDNTFAALIIIFTIRAMQFVSNITQSPLAFGLNETTNSDHRIFNVDGGGMISRMAASQAFFLDTCTSLLSRMIDTVPRNVTLTEPIQLVRVKPVELDIDVFVNGTMTIRGKIRV
ncbi:heme peroxidase [Thozetella sp. PMI_491]|nr:heme peroxidase [Thozetella sp. PMI_491]